MLCHSNQSVKVGIINNPMSRDRGFRKKKRVKGKRDWEYAETCPLCAHGVAAGLQAIFSYPHKLSLRKWSERDEKRLG